MHKYLFKFQAVNLEQFVTDTEDLATIRGGGLLLRQFPEKLLNSVLETARLVSKGGSALIVELDCQSKDDASAKLAKVLDWLRTDSSYRFATFTGAFVKLGDCSFEQCLQQINSLGHQQQMTRLDVSLPPPNFDQHVAGTHRKLFCDIDGIRPRHEESPQSSDTKLRIPGVQLDERDDALVSRSVNVRRNFGRANKQLFLKELSGIGPADQKSEASDPLLSVSVPGEDAPIRVDRTTWHFEHLSAAGDDQNSASIPSRLIGKIAVLYFDGNGFSELEASASRSAGALAEWDAQLHQAQKEVVRSLLKWIESAAEGWLVNVAATRDGLVEEETQLRFETLMWGGDDIVWVVPAWKALEFASQFFKSASERRISGNSVSFSGGMVLANHKVPIRETVNLAKRLLYSAKESLRGQTLQNQLAYQVLESFDHLGEEFEQLRTSMRPPVLTADDYVLNDQTLALLLEARTRLTDPKGRGLIPASRRHAICAALQRGDLVQVQRLFDRLIQLSGKQEVNGDSTARNVAEYVSSLPGEWGRRCLPNDGKRAEIYSHDSMSVWMHLFELWDYLPVQKVSHA